MTEPVRVALATPISYAGPDGTMRQGNWVELSAPTSSAFRLALKIKQQLMRAIVAEGRKIAERAASLPPAAPTEPEEKAAELLRGSDYLAMLASSDADIAGLAEKVRELFLSHGVAKIEGETRVTALILDSMSMHDFEALVGEYLATFPLA